jgi:prephenate dehydrogenase
VNTRRLAVIGTGLMGASVGLAAKRAGVDSVAGSDADPEALAVALERGAVDVASEELGAAVEGADLVVVATPVRTVPEIAAAVAELSGERCTITDVGSTKGKICSELADVPNFVGGHPLCGSAEAGPRSARADLFQDATWFLTPDGTSNPEATAVVSTFAAALGARPVEIDPESHDRLVALVSHLPHALANLLVAQAGAARIGDHDPVAVAGTSFRDLTRVAGANPSVWTDIFLDNAEPLAAALAEYRGRIEELEAAVRSEDAAALRRSIEAAAARRRG